MKTDEAGFCFLEEREGKRNVAYPDPATKGPPWTIGVGHTGPEVRPGLVWTDEQVRQALAKDVERFERCINSAVRVPLTQPQFNALLSFTFNLGEGALLSSTLLKRLNASDYQGAASEFLRWNRAGGRVMEGLTNRRKMEAALFLSEAA